MFTGGLKCSCSEKVSKITMKTLIPFLVKLVGYNLQFSQKRSEITSIFHCPKNEVKDFFMKCEKMPMFFRKSYFRDILWTNVCIFIILEK